MHIEAKLSQMGLTLPEPGPPAGNYVGAVRVGNLLFVSGHGPRRHMQQLPMNIPVEIEMIVEVQE